MRKPPDIPTFFVDRDLGPRFYSAIAGDGRFQVEFHDAHYPGNAPDDETWLRLIADRNWIGVTHDKKIRKEHRPIITGIGVRLIVSVGRKPFADQAANFIATYPKIERFVRKHPAPYIAKLYQPTGRESNRLRPKGRIEMWGEW